MNVGDISITAVHDGRFVVPATGFFLSTSEQDWAPHRAFLTPDGQLPLELGGFLVRTGDRLVLIDTGAGRRHEPGFGQLLASLAAVGVEPADITDVVFTHLHFDHVGWASDGGQIVFPQATHRCHQRDWDHFCGPDPDVEVLARSIFHSLPAAERLGPVAARIETWSGDVTIAPGIDVRSAPGHTPGSTVIVLSSGSERALLLGDVAHCPVELLDDEWAALGDVDPALARRTRQVWAAEMEGTGVAAAAAHFPGMQFGRLISGQGRRRWVFGS
jgi:glyoxylase-like metal-dependent hydrolase (beta-lactamase superfamily II)